MTTAEEYKYLLGVEDKAAHGHFNSETCKISKQYIKKWYSLWSHSEKYVLSKYLCQNCPIHDLLKPDEMTC